MLTRAYLSGKIIVSAFIAIVYYSYLLAPDWMWMYFVRDSDMPRWMVFYILILYYFAYDVGFFLKFELAKIRSSFPALMVAIALAASVIVVLPLKDRYTKVGTYDEYHAGGGVALPQSAVGTVPGILSALLAPLAIGLLVWSRRQKF